MYLYVIESHLFYSSEEHDSGNMYFCFRWLIINFKREFNFDDIMILWEVSSRMPGIGQNNNDWREKYKPG